jgi:hypothetical protein
MGSSTTSHQMRADNYSLSEETKRLRDHEQHEITDKAYTEALRLVLDHRRHLDVLANALLEQETLERDEIDLLLIDLQPESNASGQIGVEIPRDAGAGQPSVHRPEPALHSEPPEQPDQL